MCKRKYNNLNIKSSDFLKLRLRGKGSGYMEGPAKKGSLFNF